MSKIQINSKYFADTDNIYKLVEKKHPKCSRCAKTWVYLKEGYPNILKASGSKREFLGKLLKNGLSEERYKELRDTK